MRSYQSPLDVYLGLGMRRLKAKFSTIDSVMILSKLRFDFDAYLIIAMFLSSRCLFLVKFGMIGEMFFDDGSQVLVFGIVSSDKSYFFLKNVDPIPELKLDLSIFINFLLKFVKPLNISNLLHLLFHLGFKMFNYEARIFIRTVFEFKLHLEWFQTIFYSINSLLVYLLEDSDGVTQPLKLTLQTHSILFINLLYFLALIFQKNLLLLTNSYLFSQSSHIFIKSADCLVFLFKFLLSLLQNANLFFLFIFKGLFNSR